jgi:tRNA threonylcarbamoyladenosine biosynthesis protein TsaB
MLWSMDLVENPKLLLIDTCSDAAGVALSGGEHGMEGAALSPRGASAEIIAAVRRLLRGRSWVLADLDGIGVVSGPGSFTGVRTGLAAAKGLAEAHSVGLAAVSRLEVLAEAAELGNSGVALLDAGRGEVYVRDEGEIGGANEWLCRIEELPGRLTGRSVAVAEQRIAERLTSMGFGDVVLRPLTVGDALRPVMRCLHSGGSDVAMVDANYVRRESDIYRAAGSNATIERSAGATE